jgi:hypothetical protein
MAEMQLMELFAENFGLGAQEAGSDIPVGPGGGKLLEGEFLGDIFVVVFLIGHWQPSSAPPL